MAISEKTERWLNKNALSSFNGKNVLITGATSGVGLKSAELMIYLKARVIMAVRNTEKAHSVKQALLSEYPNAQIDIIRFDLADFKAIDEFIRQIKQSHTDIDVFLNNAGAFRKPDMLTADGFDMVLGTNYLGVFYLTEGIIPYLKTLPHEVLYVNTVSIIHKIASISYDDFFYTKKQNSLAVYARSKLCLAKYTYELAKRCAGTNVRVVMNHPGIAITPLGVDAFGAGIKRLSKTFGGIFNSPEKSALSLPYIISKDIPAGSIIGPNRLLGGWGYPKKNRVLKKVKTGGEELIKFTNGQIGNRHKD